MSALIAAKNASARSIRCSSDKAGAAAGVALRRAASLDPLWQRFEAVLARPSSCNQPPSTPPSRALIHRPYGEAREAVRDSVQPARSVVAADVHRALPGYGLRPYRYPCMRRQSIIVQQRREPPS
jgi:hypothetical protein